MRSSNQRSKPVVLWIAVKLIDKSVNRVTLFEMAGNINSTFDVHFMAGWRDKPISQAVGGRPILYFPQYGKGILRKITRRMFIRQAVTSQINKVLPDVVLFNCLDNVSLAKAICKVCKNKGVRLVLDVRTLPTIEKGGSAWIRYKKIIQLASREFDGVTYITEEIRRYCKNHYQLPRHANAIWTSGVNPDLFPMKVAIDNSKPFKLIYHGGIISAVRGLDRLIQSIDLVRDLDVHLTLISSLREPETIAWIDRLGLHEQISLIETIPHEQVPGQIQQCHAGILPFPDFDAWNTSSPIKLFEYLACGKPVIVTDIPAHRNILKNKPFAFFSPDATPQALADTIRKAYAARSRFGEYGVLARQQVLDHHTWERQSAQLKEFIKSILRTHSN